MEIKDLILVKFVSRPNRFTIEFRNSKNELNLAHLHDPGRLKELLIEDAELLIKYDPDYEKKGRKTKYDVISIKYEGQWVLLNSGYHNALVNELINEKKITDINDFHIFKKEHTYGNSRLDFLLKNHENKEMFLEVKGCTLVEDSVAKFPDAPTKRGKKHVEELIKIKEDCLLSSIIILVLQNSAKVFSPNYKTDEAFSEALKKAYDKNVQIFPAHIITKYENNTIKLTYDKILPIKFRKNEKIY